MHLPAGTFNYKYFADWHKIKKGKILAQHDKHSEVSLCNEWTIEDITVSYESKYAK